MAKCAICGKSTLLNGSVKLSDAVICGKCFKSLGFGLMEAYKLKDYPLDQVRLGKLEMEKQQIRDNIVSSISVTMNTGERELFATTEEERIFDLVTEMFDEPDLLELVRLSDNYLTIRLNGYDLIRYNFTLRSKWLNFPEVEKSSQRHEIDVPLDVLDYEKIIKESASKIVMYSND